MNAKLRQKAKSHFEKKFFFKLMNSAVLKKLWKMWEKIEILNL